MQTCQLPFIHPAKDFAERLLCCGGLGIEQDGLERPDFDAELFACPCKEGVPVFFLESDQLRWVLFMEAERFKEDEL